MKRTRLSILISLSLLLANVLLFSCPRPTQPPDNKKVAQALDEIKKAEIAAHQEMNRTSHADQNLSTQLKDNRFFLRALLISVAVFMVLAVLFFLVRFIFTRRFGRSKKPKTPFALETGIGVEATVDKLLELAESGRFREAIVYLHRLTIRSLLERKLIPSKNLTNYGVRSRLKDASLADGFRRIAEASERILFDRQPADRADYEYCRAAYETCFGGGAG